MSQPSSRFAWRRTPWFVFFVGVILLGSSRAAVSQEATPVPEGEEEKEGEVTRENSPQFAKDYDSIETLRVMVALTSPTDAGSGGDLWNLQLTPENEATAREFLRGLLDEYPLQRPFCPTQAKLSLAEEHVLCFYKETASGMERVFDITMFPHGSDLEVEQRANIKYVGRDIIPVNAAGRAIPIMGDVKVKLYALMAECAAQRNPGAAAAFRRIADAARSQQRVVMGTKVTALVVATLVVGLILWLTIRRFGSSSKAPDDTRGDAAPRNA